MNEEFLHYLWKFRLFNQLNLTTAEGEAIEILKVGEHNFDAGPDFFNAKIKIGDTVWAGNIEIHINASDFYKHSHQNDKAFDTIILHVVYNADTPIKRSTGDVIHTLELKKLINPTVHKNYLRFKSSLDWIPCEKQLGDVPPLIINSTIDKLVLERLENKSKLITQNLELNNYNLEETFYQQLAKSFGFKTNAEPFELLAKSLPILVLAKHKNSLMQIEALLFGQAGMLNEYYKDKYLQTLQNEYAFLRQKFKLNYIDAHLWKYLRLRPVNFPTIRISQFANLIFKSSHLFSKILETEDLLLLKKNLDTTVSEYWLTHYTFDKSAKQSSKKLGEDAINTILINTVVPFLFVYGKYKGEEKYVERALYFLEKTEAENNAIIKKWKNLRLSVKNAYTSQALLQLKNEYCSHKKCLNCTIGNHLLKKV